MAKLVAVSERVESDSERRIRIFLAILFLLQSVLTAAPFIHGDVESEEGSGYAFLTAINLLVQENGYPNSSTIILAICGGLLVVLPAVAFFFCVLDKKSKVKFAVSAAASVIPAIIITFFLRDMISIGAVLTLIINVIALFMTMQGVQATSLRRYQQSKK